MSFSEVSAAKFLRTLYLNVLTGTYTGHYEPVKEMAALLDEYEARTGISVPIHVDGASGAFIAPFATVH